MIAILDGQEVESAIAHREGPRSQTPIPRGVFETILVERGRARLARAHATRFVQGCSSIGLDAPDRAELHRTMTDLAARQSGRARLRLMRWRDGDRTRSLSTIDPAPPASRTGTLVVSTARRSTGDSEYHQKRIDAADLNRERALAAATEGCLDRLILDGAGHALEGSKTNVLWRVGRVLFTPPRSAPILPGIRREWLLRAAARAGLETREVLAPVSDLRKADEIMLTNALVRVIRDVQIA